MNGQTLSLRRRVYNRGMRALVWLCAGLTCALLVFLIGFLLLFLMTLQQQFSM